MVSRSRMPPPICTGMSSATALMMDLMAASFLGLPATAPFRSTRCRRLAPCSSHCVAMAAGSSEKMVASSRSPWRRRTQRPSFRSMAGMSSMMLWIPINKIPIQAQTMVGAFFGMELYCENVSRCHGTGKARSVVTYPNSKRRIVRFGIVAMHKIKMGLVRYALPQCVAARLLDAIPPHVGHLQPLLFQHAQRRVGILPARETLDAARKKAQARDVAFFAFGKQHLLAHADAQQGLVAGCSDNRVAQARFVQRAHAVGHGA